MGSSLIRFLTGWESLRTVITLVTLVGYRGQHAHHARKIILTSSYLTPFVWRNAQLDDMGMQAMSAHNAVLSARDVKDRQQIVLSALNLELSSMSIALDRAHVSANALMAFTMTLRTENAWRVKKIVSHVTVEMLAWLVPSALSSTKAHA